MEIDSSTFVAIRFLALIVLGFAVFAGVLIVRHLVIRNDMRRIADHLAAGGATDIIISWRSFQSRPGFNFYDVEYALHGQQCQTSCIIRWGLGANRDVYWKDPLQN